MHGWGGADRQTSEEDVRIKREQLREIEEHLNKIQDNLDTALEKNQKLMVFRQASTMSLKKLHEKEEELEKVLEIKRRITRQYEDKEEELQASGVDTKNPKIDLKKYGAIVRDKIEKYKRMREELASLRNELVILQRTETILKTRDEKIDEYYQELERIKGVVGARAEQETVGILTLQTAEVDIAKNATLEQISQLVEQIGREFKNKQAQLQPIIAELKNMRVEYMEIDSSHKSKKEQYDKIVVGLDMDKQGLERECDTLQDEATREESRYHYLNNLIAINKIKLERVEKERKYQLGEGRMLRDFASYDELYTVYFFFNFLLL